MRTPLSSATMDATLTRLEQHVPWIPAVRLEQQGLGPVRGVQGTAARATAWLQHYPWLILLGGTLLGSQLHRGNGRPVRPV
jgi:hypothetical protein